ncbi:MAG: multicopper oxidase family protein [Nitrospirae bacterium]|nr:multicopper oxidase family protein [Nitrospirota bacterium]
MKNTFIMKRAAWMLLIAAALVFGGPRAYAAIDGITGPTFNLTARAGYISTSEGGSYLMWGYADGAGLMQYPGPTLIVNQGDLVTVNLSNQLTVPVSIVFPGQSGVTAVGGTTGLLTSEAPAAGGTVTYSFTAAQPGTYTYYSGTRPELQIEMGLMGALIVRPTVNPATRAYGHSDSQFDHEYLFLLSEMDPDIHDQVAAGNMNPMDTTTYFPVYWFINGRTAPDTMGMAHDPLLPHQPYNIVPFMHPGEKVLLRMIGGGRDLHPFHTHGNHHKVIARDGRMLSSGVGADLAEMAFTTTVVPGSTADAIFTWTGEKLGWDMYGYTNATHPAYCSASGNPTAAYPADKLSQLPTDRCKPFPVTLPDQTDITNGQFYSGSPFLGSMGYIPPGEGGYNPNSGFLYMWHSHAEKEITNFDIFPGGMLTMLFIEAPGVTLMEP